MFGSSFRSRIFVLFLTSAAVAGSGISCTSQKLERAGVSSVSGEAIVGDNSSKSREPFVSDVDWRPKAPPSPRVGLIQSLLNKSRPGHHWGTGSAIDASVTLQKATLFDRDFLYGVTVQAIADEQELQQAFALPHSIANFRKFGPNLQLVADERHLYQADFRKAKRLIHEWRILAEDSQHITVSLESRADLLSTMFGGPAPVTRWVRDVVFDEKENVLIMESTYETRDNKVYDLAESLFPREKLVRRPFRVTYNDPNVNEDAARYRFIGGSPLWTQLTTGSERVRTAVAVRFDIQPGEVIDWWVTSNVPKEVIPSIRRGVEGWNRYFQAMWGKDGIRFRGVLPEDVKFGDPRYNVILWDPDSEAGAAWESQQYDPLTGIQSHAVIYMPHAWIEYGDQFWSTAGGVPFEEKQEKIFEQSLARMERLDGGGIVPPALQKLFQLNPIQCFHEIGAQTPAPSAAGPPLSGLRLLEEVVMHEVGHALGLGHNFKASTVWTPADLKSPYSASVMDYNQYQFAPEVFPAKDVADASGPLLEYDRQLLSVLYNDSKDVKPGDAVIPACGDREADSMEGGADPQCVRYDAGPDPATQLELAWQMIVDKNAGMGPTRSLPDAIDHLFIAPPPQPSADANEVAATLLLQLEQLSALRDYYTRSGPQSLIYSVLNAAKVLRVHRPTTGWSPLVSVDLRKRVWNAYINIDATGMQSADLSASIAAFSDRLKTWGVSEVNRLALPQQLSQAIGQFVDAQIQKNWTDANAVQVPKILWGGVGVRSKYSAQAPFWMAAAPAPDFEALVLRGLERALLVPPAAGRAKTKSLQDYMVSAIFSYKSTPLGLSISQRLEVVLNTEISNATNVTERQALRSLLDELRTGAASTP